MWLWERKKLRDGFPEDFSIQKITSQAIQALSELTVPEIAEYFRNHSDIAKALLTESYDKCFSSSTFPAEEGDEYSVGWFSPVAGYQCERQFSNLADAATDYVLFSLGKGRWTAPEGRTD